MDVYGETLSPPLVLTADTPFVRHLLFTRPRSSSLLDQ